MDKIVNGVASEYEIPITKKDITFYGNTKEEKKANEMIFDLSMTIDRQQQELNQYKKNWEELKKYCEFQNNKLCKDPLKNQKSLSIVNWVLNKMKELEEGK